MGLISENYNLIITEQAQEDIYSYIETIHYEYDSPRTAKKHYTDLYLFFEKIKQHPTAYPVRYNLSLRIYGYNVRRVNYKKMAIIYTINENTIYIHRIIPGNLITSI
jgi:plasmid stabilization system protein ParE